MVRFLLNLTLAFAFVLPVLADARSRAKAAAKPAAPAAEVNYDDPNLAFTPDYAADTAVTCPKTLKGRRLRACLLKNGLAAGDDPASGSEILTTATSGAYH
jgi:hypothetical protein